MSSMNHLHQYFLSSNELKIINEANRSKVNTINISLDLGVSIHKILVRDDSSILIDDEIIPLPNMSLLKNDQRTILKYSNGIWNKWQLYEKKSNKFYKMVYTKPGKPPTVEISGIKMHVTQGSDPIIDTNNKILSFRSLRGFVLDTCLGLGYTSIAAGSLNQIEHIYCCEFDKNIFQLCSENPWSQDLFSKKNIYPIIINVVDFLKLIPDNFLNIIIHDPPRFSLAPALYDITLYQLFFNKLKKGGEVYHYTGNPNTRTRKNPLYLETISRLKDVGFRKVKKAYAGVFACK
jgi:predicted methyltransferase